MKERKLSDYSITHIKTTEYRNQRLDNTDFSGQQLEHLRFFDSTLTNCSFDHSVCRDLRMWGTTLRDCTFREADIRDSALGSAHNGKCNRFEGVLFDRTDMRGTYYQSADFVDCSFDHAKLTKVDFHGGRFTQSVFAASCARFFSMTTDFVARRLKPIEWRRLISVKRNSVGFSFAGSTWRGWYFHPTTITL
jgi:uncharacterized protein YjbI with pentapeptide repeats